VGLEGVAARAGLLDAALERAVLPRRAVDELGRRDADEDGVQLPAGAAPRRRVVDHQSPQLVVLLDEGARELVLERRAPDGALEVAVGRRAGRRGAPLGPHGGVHGEAVVDRRLDVVGRLLPRHLPGALRTVDRAGHGRPRHAAVARAPGAPAEVLAHGRHEHVDDAGPALAALAALEAVLVGEGVRRRREVRVAVEGEHGLPAGDAHGDLARRRAAEGEQQREGGAGAAHRASGVKLMSTFP